MKYLIALSLMIFTVGCSHGPVKHLRANCDPADAEAKKGHGQGLFYCEDLPENKVRERN